MCGGRRSRRAHEQMMTATCLSSKKRQRRASAQPFSKAFFSTRPDFGNSKGGPSIRSLAGQLRPQGDSTRLDSGLAPHPRHVGMAHADRRCSGCGTPHNFRARPHVSPRLLIFAQPSRLSRIHAAHSRWIAGDNEFSRSGPRSTSLGRRGRTCWFVDVALPSQQDPPASER